MSTSKTVFEKEFPKLFEEMEGKSEKEIQKTIDELNLREMKKQKYLN